MTPIHPDEDPMNVSGVVLPDVPRVVPDDDVCDSCMRSGVEIAFTNDDGMTVCTECDQTGETPRYHKRRAARGEAALKAYADAVGGTNANNPLDLLTVRDLCQDLLHWIARHDEEGEPVFGAIDSLKDAVGEATRDFPRELKEDEDESEDDPPRYLDDRADRVQCVVDAYRISMAGGQDEDNLIRDMIQDLMHWWAREDPDIDPIEAMRDAAETACNDYDFEIAEADE